MSTLYNGSICLSDIPKDKITTSEKNGKKYLNVNIWVNDDKDQYGNIGSINVSQTKEEREAQVKKVYIGNFKPLPGATPQTQAATGASVIGKPIQQDLADDLPF